MQHQGIGRNARAGKKAFAVTGTLLSGTLLAGGLLWSAGVADTHGRAQSALPVPDATLNLPDERLVTINFEDAPVAKVLGMLADQTGINIVIAGDVSGNIGKLAFKDAQPEIVLQRIVGAAGLKYRKFPDGSYIVGKAFAEEASEASTVDSRIIRPGGEVLAPSLGGAAPAIPSLTIPTLAGPDNASTGPVGTRRVTVPLRYVPASVAAWQLDGQNQPMPIQIQTSQDNRNSSRQSRENRGRYAVPVGDQERVRGARFSNPYAGSGNVGNLGQFGTPFTEANPQFGNNRGGGGFGNQGGGNNNRNNGGGGGDGGGLSLPPGVQNIVAIDPQNLILVQIEDTPIGQRGFEELRRLIADLDRPFQQVEIEAQFVTLSETATKRLGLNFTSSRGNFNVNFSGGAATLGGNFLVNYARRNFQTTLSALENEGRAKIVQSPRVLAINNLTARVGTQRSFPIILSTTAQNPGAGVPGALFAQQDLVYITTNIELAVTPTINNDGTVTVVLAPRIETPAQGFDALSGDAPPVDSSFVETVAIVQDGDTIALGGVRQKTSSQSEQGIPFLKDIPILGRLFRNTTRSLSDQDLVIFLTARVVRRAPIDGFVEGADVNPITVPVG